MIYKTVKLYEDRDDVTLTGYILDDAPELLNGKTRPAILICPGGGYFSLAVNEAEPVALRFASLGYHTFVLRYSVYFEGKAPKLDFSRPMEPNKKTMYPTPMLEIGLAMRLIREHAGEWYVDTDRIALCGFSAGGHNAAMFATKWHTPMITEALGGTSEMYRPSALILGYSLTDMVYMDETLTTRDRMNVAFFNGMNEAYVGEARPNMEILRDISPALNVTEHMPPTYIWATAADNLVPVQHSIRMAHALADRKIPFELHIFEDGHHGLALCDQSTAQARTMVTPAACWVPMAATWLEKRMALELPEMTPLERAMSMRGNK